jgi:hypothetical protein
MKLNHMSMEDLSRLARNIGHDRELREAALRELAKRENNNAQRRGSGSMRALTPLSYSEYYL